jgi:hypothetical protein
MWRGLTVTASLMMTFLFWEMSTSAMSATDTGHQNIVEDLPPETDCQISEAAREAIDVATEAWMKASNVPEALELILRAEAAIKPPNCDSTKAIELAGRAKQWAECNVSEAALNSISNAKIAASRDGKISMAALDLIDKAEKITGPPECDSARAMTLANRAIDLARIEFLEETSGYRLPWGESEFGIELGFFTYSGTDFQITYRLKESPWLMGYRYAKWTDTIGQTSYDNELESEVSGPLVRYLFKPEADESWYLGASYLKKSRNLTCEISGDSASDSVTGPFIGGGFMGWRDRLIHYNIGILFGGGTLVNEADGCSKRTTPIDISFAIGITF